MLVVQMKLTILLVTCLTVANAGYRRHFRKHIPTLIPTKAPLFPSDMPPKALNHLKIPSVEFCNSIDLQPAYHYVVLPWWYHFCQKMKEENNMAAEKKLPHLLQYKKLLDEVQEHRKKSGLNKMLYVKRRQAAHIKRL